MADETKETGSLHEQEPEDEVPELTMRIVFDEAFLRFKSDYSRQEQVKEFDENFFKHLDRLNLGQLHVCHCCFFTKLKGKKVVVRVRYQDYPEQVFRGKIVGVGDTTITISEGFLRGCVLIGSNSIKSLSIL